MFHEASLQSGIALAIKESKLVACFVRDDGATSKQWEEEWLKSGWLSSLLEQKAVLLRIEAGSTEAGFLAPFCDLQDIPTFVVIQGGKLQIQLKSDATQTDFINEVRRVLGANPIPGSSPAQPSTPQPTIPQAEPPVAQADAEDDLYGDPVPAPTASAKGKGKQKATATPSSNAVTASVTKVQQEARDALRKKKRQEAEDLARVKARIEADRTARKAEAELRRLEREKERGAEAQQQTQTQPRTTASSRGSRSKTVNLQVRLFDGRTIRSTFPRTANLQDDVRKWVDEEFSKLASDDPNINNKQLPPYFFRHILTPQPSRELSAGDENQTLGDIDLAPSATLVLVAVKGYTEAYAGGGGVVGTATGLVGGAFGLLSSTVGLVGSTLGSVIGYGAAPALDAQPSSSQTPAQPPQQPAPSNANADGSGIRVRTLADQRAREPRDQQFYNGNQLDTLPNTDDDSDRR